MIACEMGSMVGMPFWWIVVPGTLLVASVLALRVWLTRRGTASSNALRILQERLARGEIDVEEFERGRQALKGSK